ncbi:MAG: DUF4397 domain-containing protein [Chitinophagaceae bacterium]
MIKFSYLCALSGILLFTSPGCSKDDSYKATYVTTNNTKALLKVNYLSAYATNPGVIISINQVRMSGVITSPTPFPGGGYNVNGSNFPDYLALVPGNVQMAFTVPNRGTGIDSIRLFSTELQLQAGKNYTAHVTDTFVRTKVVLVEDDLTPAQPGTAKFKFLNLMPNVAAIDLYYGADLVMGNIPYLGVSPNFTVATPTAALPWTIRESGSSPTTAALATYSSSNTTLSRRVYTAFAIGYKGATDAVRKPAISFLINY